MPLFVCSFWSILFALDIFTEGRTRQRVSLFIFMLTATALYFGHCIFFIHSTNLIPFSDTIYCVANLAVYPLYYIYICELTTRREHKRSYWPFLLPAFVAGFFVGLFYLLMSPEETELFIHNYLYNNERLFETPLIGLQTFAHDTCKVLFALILVPVIVNGLKYISRYENLLRCTYADIEDKSLAAIHHMLIFFVATSIISFAANIIGRAFFDEQKWLLFIPSILFSVMLFTLGYIGHKQRFSIQDIESDEKIADEVIEEETNIAELRARIEQVVQSEQMFLQPNLKIVDLVKRLNTNRNYIYKAINLGKGVSFTEYINRMRIDYAKNLIDKNTEMTLGEIAFQSGFSSNTSFYRNFKQLIGLGPKEYQSSLRNKKNRPDSQTV